MGLRRNWGPRSRLRVAQGRTLPPYPPVRSDPNLFSPRSGRGFLVTVVREWKRSKTHDFAEVIAVFGLLIAFGSSKLA